MPSNLVTSIKSVTLSSRTRLRLERLLHFLLSAMPRTINVVIALYAVYNKGPFTNDVISLGGGGLSKMTVDDGAGDLAEHEFIICHAVLNFFPKFFLQFDWDKMEIITKLWFHKHAMIE